MKSHIWVSNLNGRKYLIPIAVMVATVSSKNPAQGMVFYTHEPHDVSPLETSESIEQIAALIEAAELSALLAPDPRIEVLDTIGIDTVAHINDIVDLAHKGSEMLAPDPRVAVLEAAIHEQIELMEHTCNEAGSQILQAALLIAAERGEG